MGKHGKKQQRQNQRVNRQRFSHFSEDGDFYDGSSEYPPSSSPPNEVVEEEEEVEEGNEEGPASDENSSVPSKYLLYQQSVQSPKGDISYLQKFFLMYVGGRIPLHLQEDFCGTAFLSAEWLHGDARRTAVGLDLDVDALVWCLKNNVENIDIDQSNSRISLFNGNVLQPHEAKLVRVKPEELTGAVKLNDEVEEKCGQDDSHTFPETVVDSATSAACGKTMKDLPLPARDIVCAFNYSCCCLHKRKELVSYFRHARGVLSTKGGIFVMDLYGGSSSEHALRLKRRFPNFMYTWEQEEFDIIQRKTRISLHYDLQKPKRKIRHAFSYSWRLWSLPEIKDCLEEAGFKSIHFWIREMPNSDEMRVTKGFSASRDDKYEEASSFRQQDSWNAYVVAVA